MNGFVKILFAGLATSAALLAATPVTLAADLVEPPAPEVAIPPSVAGGWYLRGDIGGSWGHSRGADYEVPSLETSCGGTCPIMGGKNHTGGGDLKGSFLIGGGVGYQVTDYFRTDLTLDYMTRARFDGNGVDGTCNSDPENEYVACSSSYGAKMSALSLLANAYVDLGNFSGFTPYVGAGIGGTRVKWSNVVQNTDPSATFQDGTTYDGASNWRFTYALMAGVSVDLAQNLKLDAGYRYRHVNGGKMFSGNQYIGDGYDKGLNIHDVRVGLRYTFGGGSGGYGGAQQASTIVDSPVYK